MAFILLWDDRERVTLTINVTFSQPGLRLALAASLANVVFIDTLRRCGKLDVSGYAPLFQMGLFRGSLRFGVSISALRQRPIATGWI